MTAGELTTWLGGEELPEARAPDPSGAPDRRGRRRSWLVLLLLTTGVWVFLLGIGGVAQATDPIAVQDNPANAVPPATSNSPTTPKHTSPTVTSPPADKPGPPTTGNPDPTPAADPATPGDPATPADPADPATSQPAPTSRGPLADEPGHPDSGPPPTTPVGSTPSAEPSTHLDPASDPPAGTPTTPPSNGLDQKAPADPAAAPGTEPASTPGALPAPAADPGTRTEVKALTSGTEPAVSSVATALSTTTAAHAPQSLQPTRSAANCAVTVADALVLLGSGSAAPTSPLHATPSGYTAPADTATLTSQAPPTSLETPLAPLSPLGPFPTPLPTPTPLQTTGSCSGASAGASDRDGRHGPTAGVADAVLPGDDRSRSPSGLSWFVDASAARPFAWPDQPGSRTG